MALALRELVVASNIFCTGSPPIHSYFLLTTIKRGGESQCSYHTRQMETQLSHHSDPLFFDRLPPCSSSSSPTSIISSSSCILTEDTDVPTTTTTATTKRRKSVQFAYPLVVGTYERPKATREEKFHLYWSERDISEFRDNYVRVDMLCKLSGLSSTTNNDNAPTTSVTPQKKYPNNTTATRQDDDDITSHHTFLLRDIFLFTDSLFHFFANEQHQKNLKG